MKRKILSAVLSLVITVTFLPMVNLDALAEATDEFIQNNVGYKVLSEPSLDTHGTVQVGNGVVGSGMCGKFFTKSISIPEYVENNGKCYDIVKISDNAFYGCSRLESIYISIDSHIENLGYAAFYGCENLCSMKLPASVQIIGEKCFERCILLSEIIFPSDSNLIEIGAYAFYKCESIDEVIIPDEIMELEPYTFCGCLSLKNVVLPENLKIIGDYTFFSCVNLIELIIPDGVIGIDRYALGNCEELSFVDIPSTVQYISEGAFCYCRNLEEVIFAHNSNIIIASDAFKGCLKLSSGVWFPKRLKLLI